MAARYTSSVLGLEHNSTCSTHVFGAASAGHVVFTASAIHRDRREPATASTTTLTSLNKGTIRRSLPERKGLMKRAVFPSEILKNVPLRGEFVDKKRLLVALWIVASAALTGCATPGTGGKVVLKTDKIYPPIGPYSQMVGYGNLIYFSGLIALNKAGTAIEGATIEEQTKLVLDYIGAGLESQGLTYDDVLSSTVYMKDLNEFTAMNGVYGQYFKKDPPVRSTIEVARLPRDAKIEIAIVAGRR
jgi:reactive intermediate/imine deaminase